MNREITVEKQWIENKLNLVIHSFKDTLYENDETFMEIMKKDSLAGDDLSRYKHWEWPQGVGIFGLWKMFEKTKETSYLNIITKYFDDQLALGLPSKNINTTAPFLTLAHLYEYTKKEEYREVCIEWAEWLVNELPKTKEGGFQHITSDSVNEDELWVDTLFMTVLFLGKLGKILGREDWMEEAKYQFLLHIKYVSDKTTGLWYHGFTFKGNHNFVQALWGRGNSWITVAIPEFLDMIPCEYSVKKYLVEALLCQLEGLKKYQDECGMWHTLLDDKDSYLEASATCAISYGILKAVHMGIVDEKYSECAYKALTPILDLINEEGHLGQVSYGTYMGRASKDYYKGIEIRTMPYGQAMAILFLLEVLN